MRNQSSQCLLVDCTQTDWARLLRRWVSVMSGVDVYSPSGEMIARVLCPETVANAAFGGPDGDDLLLCSSTAAYLLKTKAVGAIYGGAATPLGSCSTTTTTTTTNGGTTTTTTTTRRA